MYRCHYCGYLKGGHDPNCPHPSADLALARKPWPPKVEAWERGYQDGWNGRPEAEMSPAYIMGWVKGTSDLETHENESQVWGAPD